MYLQGSYFEAEELLSPHVSNGEWDVEAALWLATIYRRTGRYEAAWAMLQTLESFERSSAWGSEISLEYRKIKESRRNKRVESL
jgi:cytochrome c-type biogenesis protein CcmH/NrfG